VEALPRKTRKAKGGARRGARGPRKGTRIEERRVREVGVALRERRETCGVAAMKREFFRWGGVVAD